MKYFKKIFLVPSKQQWANWSLPSKATLIGVYIGFISLVLFIFFSIFSQPVTKSDLQEIIKPIENIQSNILSILIEARLTCTIEQKAEIPPTEVEFWPVGDSNAYLEGNNNKIRFDFKSPVQFNRLANNQIVIVNQFSLPAGSELQHRPLKVLNDYNTLSVPIVTIVYGNSFEKMILLEISIKANGKDISYYSFNYDQFFKEGIRFRIPLDSLNISL